MASKRYEPWRQTSCLADCFEATKTESNAHHFSSAVSSAVFRLVRSFIDDRDLYSLKFEQIALDEAILAPCPIFDLELSCNYSPEDVFYSATNFGSCIKKSVKEWLDYDIDVGIGWTAVSAKQACAVPPAPSQEVEHEIISVREVQLAESSGDVFSSSASPIKVAENSFGRGEGKHLQHSGPDDAGLAAELERSMAPHPHIDSSSTSNYGISPFLFSQVSRHLLSEAETKDFVGKWFHQNHHLDMKPVVDFYKRELELNSRNHYR